MRPSSSSSPEKFDQRTTANGTVIATLSTENNDPRWDAFLQNTPAGQFQQSSIWARAKEQAGRKPIRIVMTLRDEIVGGFQILHRLKWWGSIGYLSKGPVVAPDSPEFAADLIRNVCKKRGVAGGGGPTSGCMLPNAIAARRFELDVVARVNLATWVIDLRGGFSSIEQGMDGEARRKVRQAIKQASPCERVAGRTWKPSSNSCCRRAGGKM